MQVSERREVKVWCKASTHGVAVPCQARGACSGYPWVQVLRQVPVTCAATSIGSQRCPPGSGAHPPFGTTSGVKKQRAQWQLNAACTGVLCVASVLLDARFSFCC